MKNNTSLVKKDKIQKNTIYEKNVIKNMCNYF